MNKAIPVSELSLIDAYGLYDGALGQQSPKEFIIAWRCALPIEDRIGMRGLICDIITTAISRAEQDLSCIPDIEVAVTSVNDVPAIREGDLIDALNQWKNQIKPHINQRDLDDLINAITLYRFEVDRD